MYGAPETPMEAGLFFLAVDPGALSAQAATAFSDAVAAAQQELNALPPAPGADRVLWPGQLEAERAARGREDGVALPAAIAADLERLASRLGVAA
jgi:LDH2 family malate/lactate/ureidoglycolate dehydrogenase